MDNFPGNPYLKPIEQISLTNDGAASVYAMLALVFELRTLNLQIAARPVVLEGLTPDLMRKIQEATAGADADIRERLGIEPPE